jgi:hypothetical protein
MKVVAGVAALAAIAFGASAIAGASGSGSNSAGAGGPFAGGRMQQGAPGQGGTRGGPGFGRPVTGATADKVKAAVLAKYPGTIEGVVAVPGRGYLAHVLRSGSSEVRVLVDSNFKVVGVAQGPPGGPGMRGGGPPGGGLPGGAPPGGAPSGGAPPQPGSTS